MSKNLLKKWEEDDTTQFFIAKSYVTASFDDERKKPEYAIMYIKKNSNPDAYFMGYMNLKLRNMNKKEINHFRKNLDNYKEVMRSEDGVIYHLKAKPFDKSQCPRCEQLAFF